MATTREQALAALFAKLKASYAFGASTRRLVSPETIAAPGLPALVLVVQHEEYQQRPAQPPRRTIHALAILYIDTGSDPNAIPDAVLNPIQDAIDHALLPDDPTGRCTLGGLVYSVTIAGQVIKAPGDKSGKGLAIIPIEIVIP